MILAVRRTLGTRSPLSADQRSARAGGPWRGSCWIGWAAVIVCLVPSGWLMPGETRAYATTSALSSGPGVRSGASAVGGCHLVGACGACPPALVHGRCGPSVAIASEVGGAATVFLPVAGKSLSFAVVPDGIAAGCRPRSAAQAVCVYEETSYSGSERSLQSRAIFGLSADSDVLWSGGDADLDGLIDAVKWTVYASAHRPLIEARDDDNDGVCDAIWTWHYDGAGRSVGDDYDANGDGRPDETRTREYDPAGNMVMESEDSNGDGAADYIDRLRYDTRGHVVLMLSFRAGEDAPYSSRQFLYEADLLIRINYDDDADGVTDRWLVYAYNRDGLPLRWELWEPVGLHEHVEYGYDSERRRATMAFFTEDGWRHTYSYSYDSQGRLFDAQRICADGRVDGKRYAYLGFCAHGLNAP